MDEDALKISLRKFLKTVGLTSQREIEKAIRDAAGAGRLGSGGSVRARAVITLEGIDLEHTVEGEIDLGSGTG
jgi:hypothetical protein